MNDQKKPWIWVGIAVVVIVVVAVVVVWFVRRGQTPDLGPVPVHAPVGQVVSGFPQQLILGATTTGASASSGAELFFAGITNSYSIGYSTSTNQYTAEWLSSSTPAALYAQYQAYVTKNDWTIVNHNDLATLKSVYATNASSAINIVIMPQSAKSASKGSKVTVSYVATTSNGK